MTPNVAQLVLARKLSIDAGVAGRVTFDRGCASDLQYSDDSFDAVLFFESPCHFPDRSQFFREVYRVLRPGGRLAGEDWLAMEGLSPRDTAQSIRPICDTWAIPKLGTIAGYSSDIASAGMVVKEAVDLRNEMALQRGVLVEKSTREEVLKEKCRISEPIRRIIMEGLLLLGEAVEAGAFTLGRFLAVKK